MGGRDEYGDVNGDDVPENLREFVQSLMEIVNQSEEEIYAMLVECDMDANEALNRLLFQDSFQQIKSKRNKNKQDTSVSLSQRVCSSIKNHGFRNGGDHYTGRATSNEQGHRNHVAGSSTTSSILGLKPPSNSDLTNTKRVPISSGQAVPYPFSNSFIESAAKRYQLQEPASVSNQYSHDNDVTNPFSNSFLESAAGRDQLQESASISNQNLRIGDYGGSRLLSDKDSNKNNETYQEQGCSFEHNQNELKASVKEDKPVLIIPKHLQLQVPHLRFGRYNGLPSQLLNEDSDDLSLKYLNIRDDEFHEEEEQRLRRNVVNEQTEHAQDFAFGNSQRLNHVFSPSEPSLQHQQAYEREPDSQYSASLFNPSVPTKQSNTTASSLGRRPSISMTERNQQAMNYHYSRPKVPSGQIGNTMNYRHSQPRQNGGSNNNNTYHDDLSLDEYLRMTDLSHLQNGSCMSSGNAANLRFGYDNLLSSQFNGSNHLLPSVQHQSGSDYYSHQNQESPSLRRQEQEPYRELDDERRRVYDSYLNRQNSRRRRDPSNQNQQQPWQRKNY